LLSPVESSVGEISNGELKQSHEATKQRSDEGRSVSDIRH